METEAQAASAPELNDAARAIEETPSQATDAVGDEPGTASQNAGRDLAAELLAAQARAKKAEDDVLYAHAEIENAKKRFARQSDERVAHLRKNLLLKFLPVLDNLQRAMAFENDSAGLRGGLNATLRAFESLLGSESVVPVETIHRPFDPRVAEALTTRETTEHDDDVVLEEMQRGYKLGDDVLRPALVVVARRIEPAGSNSENT
jgi:molecular chaperone GrpE